MTVAEDSTRATADAAALEIFQNQWEIYRKFLKHDYLANREACCALHRFLTDEVARPFRILDLACGDASVIVGALEGTAVAQYRGVDLSAPALELAAQSLASLPCPVELVEADFTTFLHDRAQPEDIVWISLSLHHLGSDAKLAFMRKVRSAIEEGGAFLVYEPTRREGEDRATYLDRCEGVGHREWTALTPYEFAEAMKHIRGCDFPETASGWARLGREAGFSESRELYKSPADLFRLILFRP